MSIFGGLSTPKWMDPQDLFSRGEESGMANAATFMQQYRIAHQEAIQKPMRDVQLASGILGLQQQANGIQLQEQVLRNTGEDQNTIPQWLKEHSTWSSRQDADWPVAKSRWGEQTLNETRLRDTQSIAKNVAVDDLHSFSKDLAAIDPTSRAAIQGMTPNKDGTPSANMWQALNLAKESAAVEAQNARTEAEIQARSRGDEVITKFTPKGTELTVKTPKPVASGSMPTEPQVKTFPDGTSVIYNPKGGGFHLLQNNGQTKPMTTGEMQHLYDKTEDAPFKSALGEELKKRSGVGAAPAPKTAPTNTAPAKYKSKFDVRDAFTSGKITQEEALKILADQFNIK